MQWSGSKQFDEEKNGENLESEISKINELNNKSVENILEDKLDVALDTLKKAECQLESMALGKSVKFDKKILIIVLHNLACCYQKLKDFDNCVSYLEAVIYHFDGLLEASHGIKISPEYFITVASQDHSPDPSLGDFILELRFCAKFHLQMCAVLSQANNHKDAVYHAKLAALMCEDNIIKTYHLFNHMTQKTDKSPIQTRKSKKVEDNNGASMFEDKLKESQKIIYQLTKKVIDSKKKREKKDEGKILKEKEIEEFIKSQELKISVRNILGVKKKDDWIHLLNIGNIMYLSALTFEDLDMESDPKYELLRDAILEKIVMLTVAYFCIANEVRFLNDCQLPAGEKDTGDYWHSQAVEFSCTFLPGSCPIVKHYVNSYCKQYGNTHPNIIPENEIANNAIEIIRSDLESNTDQQISVKSNPVTPQVKEKEKPPSAQIPLPKFHQRLKQKNTFERKDIINNSHNNSNSNSITLNNTSNNDLLVGNCVSSRNISKQNATSKNKQNIGLSISTAKAPLAERELPINKSSQQIHKKKDQDDKKKLSSMNANLIKPSYNAVKAVSFQSIAKVSNSYREKNFTFQMKKYQNNKNDHHVVQSRSPKPETFLKLFTGGTEQVHSLIQHKVNNSVSLSREGKTAKPIKPISFSAKINVAPKTSGIIPGNIKSNSGLKYTIRPQVQQKNEYSTSGDSFDCTLRHYNTMSKISTVPCITDEEKGGCKEYEEKIESEKN